MTLLLDTHAVLWFWGGDPKLSATAQALILDPANHKLVSPASPREVAIKISRKKLDLRVPFRGFFPRHMAWSNFDWLPADDDHFAEVTALPFYHSDPFDRLIVAQALADRLPVVSIDPKLDPYGVDRRW